MDEVKLKLKKKLQGIPDGKIAMENHFGGSADSLLIENNLYATLFENGKGKLEIYEIAPGIELCFRTYLARSLNFSHDCLERKTIEINHCRFGRIGWEMGDGSALYLGEGDMSLHDMNSCAHSEIEFPLEYYQGLCIFMDLSKVQDEFFELLKSTSIDVNQMYEKFCGKGTDGSTTILASFAVDSLFSVLYDLPKEMVVPYARVKMQELILRLKLVESPAFSREKYSKNQIETIQKVHAKMIENLDKRYTIDVLSSEFLMNQTTLKAVFKKVYGKPIASYMKDYRMKKASEMLKESDMLLFDVARAVGYSSQSKFSQAFKETYGVVPSVKNKCLPVLSNDRIIRFERTCLEYEKSY